MRGVPTWPDVADAIAQRVEQALADPAHPWAQRWPTSNEMAEQLQVAPSTVLTALNHLGEKGVLVKARLPRRDGEYRQRRWAPRAWVSAFPDLTPDQVAAQIMAKGMTGEWTVLPSQYVLAERFDVGRGTIQAATKTLARHRVLVKVLINGGRRWRLRPPHRIGGVDSRLTMLALQALAADVVWRDQAQAFRCPPQGDSMHERPFLANSELGHQYGAAWSTIVAIKDELRHQRPITSSVHSNAPDRAVTRVSPVDRSARPVPTSASERPSRNKRAREVANDLIGRIRDGEFFVSEFPRLVDVKTQYRVRWSTARAALDLMHQEGWVKVRWWGPRQFMALADPLPSKAAQNAGTETVAIPADQVPTVVADERAYTSPDSTSQPPRSTTAAIIVALTAHARPVTLAQLCQSAMLNVATTEARLQQLVQYRWVRRFDDAGEPAYTLDTEGRDVAETMTKQLMCPSCSDGAIPKRPEPCRLGQRHDNHV